jgi:hypothetical protein
LVALLMAAGRIEAFCGRQGVLAARYRIRHPPVSINPRLRPSGHYIARQCRRLCSRAAQRKAPGLLRLIGEATSIPGGRPDVPELAAMDRASRRGC